MTVAAAEAVPAAIERGSVTRARRPPRGSTFSDEAVAERKRIQARRSEPRRATQPASRPSRPQGRAFASPAQPQSRATGSQQQAPRRKPATARGIGRDVKRHAPTTAAHRTNYQPVILAEFIAAVLLVAATPFARKDKPGGLSPYAGTDVLQLAAITLVYLILALVSSGGRGAGRLAAWFGGLVLLTVGLGEASSIAADLNLFGIGGTKTQAGATGTTQAPGTTTAGGRG